MSQFTEQHAKESGIPLKMLKKWEDIMNYLWNFMIAFSRHSKAVKISDNDNQIQYQKGDGHQFNIRVDFVNSRYLNLVITVDGFDDFEASISMIEKFSSMGIVRCLAEILTQAETIKK